MPVGTTEENAYLGAMGRPAPSRSGQQGFSWFVAGVVCASACAGPEPGAGAPLPSTTVTSTGGGGAGGAGQGGGAAQGGAGASGTCGDGTSEPGEVCFEEAFFGAEVHRRPVLAQLDDQVPSDLLFFRMQPGEAVPAQQLMGAASSPYFQGTVANVTELNLAAPAVFATWDRDRDGLSDLVVRSVVGATFLDQATDGFAVGEELPLNGIGGPTVTALATGRLTANAFPDLIVGGIDENGSGFIYPYLSDGSAFMASPPLGFGPAASIGAVAVAPGTNGLAHAVVALQTTPSELSIMVSAFDPDADGLQMPTELPALTGLVSEMILGDVDGDTSPDLVAATSAGVLVIRNVTAPGPNPYYVPVGPTGALSVRTLDVDVDGDEDIVFGQAGTVSWLANDGEGVFEASSVRTLMEGVSGWLDVGAIRGVGRDDVVSVRTSGTVGVVALLRAP